MLTTLSFFERLMKQPVALVLAVGLLAAALAPDAEARRVAAAVAMDAETGEVLYARSADRIAYPASLTKMMTLYMTFEAIQAGKLSFDTKLTVSKRAAGMPASKLGLRRGSTIKVKDAVLALITKSANDASVVLAEALGGTEIKFAQKMTAKARELGMRKTQFRNASGLTNRYQKSTAREMAILGRRLIMDFPQHYDLFATRKFSYGKRTYRNTNKLLGQVRGVDGLKTGYTRASGFNLAASATRNGRRIIAVVLGGRTGKERNNRMVRVLNRGFELQRQMVVASMNKPVPKPTIDAVIAHLEPVPQNVAADASTERGGQPPESQEVLAQTAQPSDVLLPSFRPAPAVNSTDAQLVQSQLSSERAIGPAQDQASTDVAAKSDSELVTETLIAMGAIEPAVGGRMTLVWNGKKAVIDGPAEPQVASTAEQGPFSVQVGAYHDPQKAHKAAVLATQKLPSLLSNGDIKVSPLKGRKKPVYRARVEGFSRDVADRACVLLKQKNNDCLVVLSKAS